MIILRVTVKSQSLHDFQMTTGQEKNTPRSSGRFYMAKVGSFCFSGLSLCYQPIELQPTTMR